MSDPNDVVEELFNSPDMDAIVPKYPGSKRTVKGAEPKRTASVSVARAAALTDPDNWGHKPVIKDVGGKKVTLYTFGALATALERPLITLRAWEAHGYLPVAPFRAEHVPGKGGTAGRRYYTKEAILACLEEFQKRGLLGVPRIEWAEHSDLTIAIARRWDYIITEFYATDDIVFTEE